MQRRRRESHGRRGLLRSGRVAGSLGWRWRSDPSRAAALAPTELGGCGHCGWPSARACAEWATRGGERRHTAAYDHDISLCAFRTVLGLGVDEADSVSWRSRARRHVGSAAARRGLTGRQLTIEGKKRKRRLRLSLRLAVRCPIPGPNARARRHKRRATYVVVRSCGRAVVRSCGRAIVLRASVG